MPSGATVVLHHGIFAADELRLGPLRRPGFPGIGETLAAAGHRVIYTRVHPSASIATRAAQLRDSILRQTSESDGPVILLAHSLGGLDARHMLTHLDMSSRVPALLTISTPHRGASLAEFFHRNLQERFRVYSLLGRLMDISAAHELTRDRVARFNELTPNHPDVAYFSITCSQKWPACGHRYVFSELIYRQEGDNDGVVSTASARWGEHLGHWNCGHVAAINLRGVFGTIGPDIPHRWAQAVAEVQRRLAHPTTSPPPQPTC